MTDSTPDPLAPLRAWSPSPEDPPVLEGAADPVRSGDRHLLFSVRPCGGSWLRVPAEAVAELSVLGEVRCGPVVLPRVRVALDPGHAATPTVMDAVGAAMRSVSGPAAGGGGALLAGDGEDPGASRDVHVELEPDGKLYRIRLQVEGHEVRDVKWDGERKVYVGDVPGLPVEDALDVYLQAWGSAGAGLVCTVWVDGRDLDPALEVRVADGPGEARRSYRL